MTTGSYSSTSWGWWCHDCRRGHCARIWTYRSGLLSFLFIYIFYTFRYTNSCVVSCSMWYVICGYEDCLCVLVSWSWPASVSVPTCNYVHVISLDVCACVHVYIYIQACMYFAFTNQSIFTSIDMVKQWLFGLSFC